MNVGASAGRGGGHAMHNCSPCLTKSRAAGYGHYVMHRRRMMLKPEVERLQGFPPGRLVLPAAVTEQQYLGMLGNAFTVPVVGRVARALLVAVGAVPASLPDPWQ